MSKVILSGNYTRPSVDRVSAGEMDDVKALGTPGSESHADSEVAQKIEEFRKKPADFNSDPCGDLFPNAPPAAKGCRLVGSVDVSLQDGVLLSVCVQSDGSRSLVGDAIFLLHPTMTIPMMRVPCENNEAKIEFYSEGWFHVVAIVDQLQTVLSLDLRDVPGVPEWFKTA